MPDERSSDDVNLQLRIQSAQSKFEYAFTTLCFATLALSLQFSSREPSIWKAVLVACWAMYLISALLGGWRLMMAPQFYKMDLAHNKLDNFVRQRSFDLKQPSFLTAVAEGGVASKKTGEPLSNDEIKATLSLEQGKLKFVERNLESLQFQLVWVFRCQVMSFCLGLLLNAAYLSVNFLCPPNTNSIEEAGGSGRNKQHSEGLRWPVASSLTPHAWP